MPRKEGMSALDVRFIVHELKDALIDGRVQKVYQYGPKAKRFLFEVHKPGKGESKLYVDGSKIFLTREKQPAPQEPPSFCMFLRKHLMNKRVRNVKQHGFDRIVEIETDEATLIFELLSPGNVILIDSMRNIIMPLEIQKWKDREVKPKVPYKYPPALTDPFGLSMDGLTRMLQRTDKTVGQLLASSLGFGPVYSDEVCARAGVGKETPGKDMRMEGTAKLHNAMVEMSRQRIQPTIYEGLVTPFPLKVLEGKPKEHATSFSEAVDRFFSERFIEARVDEEKELIEERRLRIERIEEEQRKAREKWQKVSSESREEADLIYKNYQTVQSVLESIKRMKDEGKEWDGIREALKEGIKEVKEIRENEGIVVLSLEGKDVEIDIRKDIEDNAARHYEESKHAKKKLARIEEAKETVQRKVEQIEEEEPEEKEEKPKKKRRRKRWYEKFKWFLSSDGILVIAGRNAVQNENIMAKHADSTDIVFHADIKGAAFTVIKAEGKEVPNETVKEASEFSAANSKAWAKGLGKVSVFCLPREKYAKEAGMPKGTFSARGERMWFRDLELKVAIGVKVEEEAIVVYGPVMSVRKNSDYFVTIKPGFKKSLELARDIKNKIMIKARPEDKYKIDAIPMEDFEKAIPGGMGDVVEFS